MNAARTMSLPTTGLAALPTPPRPTGHTAPCADPAGPDGRAERFAELVAAARACTRCPRMAGRTRAIGPACGPLDAPVLFVAEAPGRRGADRTGVPLSADQTGRNFDRFLAGAGIDRSRVFVTNAVLCNPRTSDGRNDRPRADEVRHCAAHLGALIDLLDPPLVVSLGATALAALGLIEPHGRVLARDAGRPVAWYGRLLVPLYHPGPRGVARLGSAAHQEGFRVVAALLRRRDGRPAAQSAPTGPEP